MSKLKTKLSRHIRRTVRSDLGFSLTELLVVLVIIGVLVALLALPRFTSIMTKAKTTEARLILRQVHSLQQAYYFEHNRYSSDLDEIGFEQSTLQSDGGTAYYKIDLELVEGDFRAIATSSIDFDRDGTLNVWEVGPDGVITETVKD